ncbi:MAG: DinB family protein [Acidobacteriota bacterium]
MNADQAKFLVTFMTNLWEGEFPATCKVLAAVPDARRDYKPDDKSRSAWDLTVHIAAGDLWFLDAIRQGSFAWDAEAEKKVGGAHPNVASVVELYRREFPAKLDQVRKLSAEDLTKTVDFFGMFQWPNVSYLGFANNHSVHHRGQLASYLRAMGSKVPAIYGGSADEPMPG